MRVTYPQSLFVGVLGATFVACKRSRGTRFCRPLSAPPVPLNTFRRAPNCPKEGPPTYYSALWRVFHRTAVRSGKWGMLATTSGSTQ
jgi:hypothetical protein